MKNEALQYIAGRVEKILASQNFQRQKDIVTEEDGGEYILYQGENTCYSVLFTPNGNRFELRSAPMTDEGPDDKNWKAISSWIFDPEQDDMRTAEDIANDFCSTLDDSKRRAAIRAAKRKATKDDENNPGPVFFYKRLVSVFPELKEEIAEERESYEEFRAVTFAKAKVVGKIDALCKKNNQGAIQKLAGILQDFYKVGDMDVRSIITMVIFNGISAEARNNLLPKMEPEFQKYYKRVAPYQRKTVKPEKPKKGRRSSSSRALTTSGYAGESADNRLSGRVPRGYK